MIVFITLNYKSIRFEMPHCALENTSTAHHLMMIYFFSARARRTSKGFSRTRSVRRLRKQANKEEEVPVSTDFLSNLPCICMPGNDFTIFSLVGRYQTYHVHSDSPRITKIILMKRDHSSRSLWDKNFKNHDSNFLNMYMMPPNVYIRCSSNLA